MEVTQRVEHQDRLARVLHTLRMRSTFYCHAELSEPWALEMPAIADSVSFHVVTAGTCWLVLLQLGAGAKKAPFLLCDQRYVPVLSGRLEYPANNHCIRIRVTIGKHRALPLPQ